MKKSGYSVIIILMLTGIIPFSISMMIGSTISDAVTNAIRNGNAQELARHFGANVDLNLPGKEGTFSRNQAELILRSFFQRNVPESFTVSHKGESRDGSVYVIGVFETSAGERYRTYFLVKNVANNMVLHQLQFESP